MKWKKTLLCTSFVLSVGFSTVVPGHIACAQTKLVPISSESATITAEEIQELATDITFIFEEAVIKNSDGTIKDLDFRKIEEKFGSQVDLNQLSQFKEVLSASFLSLISAHITNKEYDIAATKVLELGIKDNLARYIIQFSWYFFKA
ncbi:hypothetical protein [Bacillus toyonensis]|uniref:hypothetical protein n=1 Tax=Bacillus toyonensis TaxID=155322 RepID=UPI000BF4B19F|nr:hypothetical protein [Bacillus toyonensis]PGC82015.1 hypothetical protein COM39_29020 [Bacillus toyonensis]